MLPARATGTVGIHTHIRHVDVHFYRIIDFRHDIAGRKRSMAPRIGVKGRNAHETVHTLLRLQKSVGIVPLDKDRDGLHACLITGQEIRRLHREAVALRPSSVHPEQHLRPVLRFRTARSRMQLQIGIVRIIRP